MPGFPDPAALTLHRPPALLVAAVLECAATGGRVRLLRGFADDPLALIEAAAQAAAVVAGADGRAAGAGPRPGALVAARAFTALRGATSEEVLEVAITWGGALGALRQAEAVIHDPAGAVVMRGVLAVAEGVEIAPADPTGEAGAGAKPPGAAEARAAPLAVDFAPLRQAESALLVVQAQPPGALVATLRFPAAFPLFAGHFPGRPLVPGVHLVAAACAAVRRAVGGGPRLAEVVRAKWSAAVRPEEEALITARWRETGTDLAVDAALTVGPTTCMTCRLLLRRGPPATGTG